MNKLFLAFGFIFVFQTALFCQDITVTGQVLDDKGISLPGVKIMVKGTNNGVLSDMEGRYSITAENSPDLIITYFFIGFDLQEQEVGNRTNIDVKMSTDSQILNEVIIVGYGSSRNKELTLSLIHI